MRGTVEPLKAKGWGRMKKVRLDLAKAESGFVVFRRGSSSPTARKNASKKGAAKGGFTVENWTVRFPAGWDAPEEPIVLTDLKPWKDLPLGEEAKAFSGTATYEAVFSIDKELAEKKLTLNLGKVDFIADVKVNGKSAGVLWTEPYVTDISDLVQEGENRLTIDVTGTWYNRLVYDASLPEPERKTWTIAGPTAGSPLHDSGLLGPVTISY